MLTATYTLVSLSVEQASARVSLQSLQKLIHNSLQRLPALSAGQVEYACDAMRHIYDTCHWRKIDQFLIPAIRGVTSGADELLLELAALNDAAADAMGALAERFCGKAVDTPEQVSAFCDAMDEFCSVLLVRLEREEAELFPLARAAISGEAWFAIANQMLVHEARVQENKPGTMPLPMPRGRLPAAQSRVSMAN